MYVYAFILPPDSNQYMFVLLKEDPILDSVCSGFSKKKEEKNLLVSYFFQADSITSYNLKQDRTSHCTFLLVINQCSNSL